MHPQIAAIVAEFRAAQERLHRLADRLQPHQWNRTDPARWSAAECIDHLNLTGRVYIPMLETALAEARQRGEPAPARYRRDPMGWILWKTMPPPVRFRLPTAPAFVPGAAQSPHELLAEFDRLQDEQVRLAQLADGLPIHRVRIPSPFNARMSYNAFSALSILPPHQERHIWQAERTVA